MNGGGACSNSVQRFDGTKLSRNFGNYIHNLFKHIHIRRQAAQVKETYRVTRVVYTVSSGTIMPYIEHELTSNKWM